MTVNMIIANNIIINLFLFLLYFIVPDCLIDDNYGEHRFIKTSSKMVFHYVVKGDKNSPVMLCLHGYPEVCNHSYSAKELWMIADT